MRRRDRSVRLGGACLALPVAALLSGACGPIEYIAAMPLDATSAVAQAKNVKAERFAPYEMTAAQEYLHKSRELAGYSRYASSVEFAHKASQLAKEAKSLADEKSRLPGADKEESAEGSDGAPAETPGPTAASPAPAPAPASSSPAPAASPAPENRSKK